MLLNNTNNAVKKTCESCGVTDYDNSCGTGGKKLLECAGCLSSYFCSTTCQQQSWKLHKKICRQRKRSVVTIQSNWRGWYTRRKIMLDDGRDRCEICGVTNNKEKQLHLSNGCRISLYCSVTCQEYGWNRHKIICKERQRAVLKIQSAWRASLPIVLPTYEALEVLLSPDGYYKYLNVPKPDIDGGAAIDLYKVGRNYRLLSLSHHPDKKSGDADTFVALKRAKDVLSCDILRRDYEVVGLDLEYYAEEEDEHAEDKLRLYKFVVWDCYIRLFVYRGLYATVVTAGGIIILESLMAG